MKKFIFIVLLIFPLYVSAQDITKSCNIYLNGVEQTVLEDSDYNTFTKYKKSDILEIKCNKKIKNIYIIYDQKTTSGTISYDNEKIKIGNNKYLHELIILKDYTKTMKLQYDDKYIISDIYLFDDNIDSWVQDWQSLEKSDMMLFSTHADDEHLFFAGLLPTYVDKKKNIQLVYLTNHYNDTSRYHELLNGLWEVGVKYYPVISTFPDEYSENLNEAIDNLKKSGYSEEDVLKYMVTNIRKYKPKVVVGHDEKGEYSHGQHILNTYILKTAIKKANDKSFDIDSYKKYGNHQINKLYLHLYNKNKIVLNLDNPLNSFDGKTAYEVSKEGFKHHKSQEYTWFTEWLYGMNNKYTYAFEIKTYSPCEYGLYYTNVGLDKNKNDMFENIKVEKKVKKQNSSNKSNKQSIDYKYIVVGCILGIFI